MNSLLLSHIVTSSNPLTHLALLLPQGAVAIQLQPMLSPLGSLELWPSQPAEFYVSARGQIATKAQDIPPP